MAELLDRVPLSQSDMRDSADEIAFWTPLRLQASVPIADAFDAVDAAAIGHRRWHRNYTLVAAISGGVAVLCAIWEMGFGGRIETLDEKLLQGLELVALIVTAGSLVLGWRQGRKNQWLVNRHRAELYRFLRFDFVVHPEAWLDGPVASEHWVTPRIAAIREMGNRNALEHSIERALLPDEQVDSPPVAPVTLVKLVEYYLSKRLSPQREYLANRAQRNAFWDGWLVRHLTTALLSLSVATAFTQLVINRKGGHLWHFENIAFATLGAASLPVVAAIIRTLRTAFEFSRNRSRFLAAHDALQTLEQRLIHHVLRSRMSEPAADMTSVTLRDMRTCEEVLRNEHQEWLRLMLEAEWVG